LRELLEPYRSGRCDVSLVYSTGEAEARFVLGAEWRIRPSAELRDKLAEAVGTSAFRFDYQEHRVN
jgi:DNA polymerase-3 subunit alpha